MTTSLRFIYSLTVLLILIFFSQTNALTKDEVYRSVTKKQKTPTFAFKAGITSKIFIQGQAITDTGKIVFSPPDCFKITMYKTKTSVSVLGDTIWTSMPNGNITRSIGTNNIPGMNNIGQSYGAPDIGEMLKKSDFKIIEEKPGKHIIIEFDIESQFGKQKAHATYDVREWIIRNMKILGGPTGTMEMGYSYIKIKGFHMVENINIVLGAMGFVKMKYNNYTIIKKVPREEFKKF